MTTPTMEIEWQEYHDGLIGLRRMNPDGTYTLVVLGYRESEEFKKEIKERNVE
jgi:hypothetical protein